MPAQLALHGVDGAGYSGSCQGRKRVLDPVVRARFMETGTLEDFLIGCERLRADLTPTLTESWPRGWLFRGGTGRNASDRWDSPR
ncbi:hypothetical protein N5079_22705 [Planotetraspora sp. A-T 1434]|uniref:hypothetical protein n=1 Tax=Planotetraspora sp. A-T 1434 TaxID=2979219 RepID=UPI0021C094C1|nr:hypothetical protein [Planotetraspora sp. A-T 1434]MCT9933023.1 hypothetical protein [Planotetraspora sp. A-T 1434]